MNDYKRSDLIKKTEISEVYYDQVFKSLSNTGIEISKIWRLLKGHLTGFYSIGCPTLLRQGEKSEKCWFINQGIVIAYYKNTLNKPIVFMIFQAGELVILPEFFLKGKRATVTLMACPDTHLLEVPADILNPILEDTKEGRSLKDWIYFADSQRHEQRDRILNCSAIDRIRLLYKLFPALRKFKGKHILSQALMASFLHIIAGSFSRLLKKINKEDRER